MTATTAELLRVRSVRGAISVGQAADIIATPENPLGRIQALRKVDFVMKNGEVVRRAKERPLVCGWVGPGLRCDELSVRTIGHFRPSGSPCSSLLIASASRRLRVSSRFAATIQPM
jgi:hypothetical protein